MINSNIEYNYLNLPTRILFADGSEKSIKRENAVINSTLDVTYNTKKYYEEKKKKR